MACCATSRMRPLAGLMRLLHLPARPAPISPPRDRLGREVAGLVHDAPANRASGWPLASITSARADNPLGRCRRRSSCRPPAESIEKQIAHRGRQEKPQLTALDLPGQIEQGLALGIISANTEAAALRDYDRKVMDIINVDDFAGRRTRGGP